MLRCQLPWVAEKGARCAGRLVWCLVPGQPLAGKAPALAWLCPVLGAAGLWTLHHSQPCYRNISCNGCSHDNHVMHDPALDAAGF